MASVKDRREIERTMQQEILETSSYPEIVYECSNIAATKGSEGQYSVTLNGELTIHGVTRSQPVWARVTLTEDSLRAFGNFPSGNRIMFETCVRGWGRVEGERRIKVLIQYSCAKERIEW